MTRATMGNVTGEVRKVGLLKSGLLRSAAAAAACLSLAGCLSIGGKVPDQLIRLTAETSAPVGSQSSGQISDAIVVLDPEADRSLDVLRVPVQVDDSSIAYLKDASWVEKPARQFRNLLAETIRAETGGLVVEGGDYEVTGKLAVGGRLLRMGYDVPTHSVIVRLDATRSVRGGEIVTKRFESTIKDVEPKVQAVGPALNRAANDVARQVADWVKGA